MCGKPTRWLLLVISLVAIWSKPVFAHDIYTDLFDASGSPCCDNADCRPAHYRVDAGGVQMFVLEQWINIPSQTIQYRAIQDDTGETGGGHWCGLRYLGQGLSYAFYVTYCAILPPNSASVLEN